MYLYVRVAKGHDNLSLVQKLYRPPFITPLAFYEDRYSPTTKKGMGAAFTVLTYSEIGIRDLDVVFRQLGLNSDVSNRVESSDITIVLPQDNRVYSVFNATVDLPSEGRDRKQKSGTWNGVNITVRKLNWLSYY